MFFIEWSVFKKDKSLDYLSVIALSVMMFLCVNQIISLVISCSGIGIGGQCFLFYCNLRRWLLLLVTIVVAHSNLAPILHLAIYRRVMMVQDLEVLDTGNIFVAMHSMMLRQR